MPQTAGPVSAGTDAAPHVVDPALRWPVPPYFAPVAEPATGHSRACSVELLDGSMISARVAPSIATRTTEVPAFVCDDPAQQIDASDVRIVRLITPITLTPRHGMLQAVGSTEFPGDRDFVVVFDDGRQFEGRTRGFVRDRCGLFLYLITDDTGSTIPCYVPASRLQDFRLGDPIGETLVQREGLSTATLTRALDKQAKLRDERLGEYLANRAIISGAELLRSLQAQKQQPHVKLGEFLLSEKLITADQLRDALATQQRNRGRRLGEILAEMGAVSEKAVQRALADKLGIPFVDARHFEIDPAIIHLVPHSLATSDQVLPLIRTADSLVVAVENPLSTSFVQELQVSTGLNIATVMASATDLKLRIAELYRHDATTPLMELPSPPASSAPPPSPTPERGTHVIEKLNIAELATELAKEVRPPERINERSDSRISDNVLVRLVNKIIVEAHAQGASDIHIECNPRNLRTHVRFRKDGDLDEYLELEPAFSSALVSRIKIMAGMDISEHRHAQDGKIDFSRFSPLAIELRVVVIPTTNSLEDVVMRILGGVEPLPLNALGLHETDLDALTRMVKRSYGLILVCGPTGSGKTTTLHSILHHINQPDMKIWTAEDPIEITQPGLRQVQISTKIGWTFAEAMRAFLRADPDVIMVGEMRDAETTKIGIEASLTGHLVFSTLHTNSAAESVVRLLDLGMDPFNFADALIGILSQRLARKLCKHCKRAHVLTDIELSDLALEYCSGDKPQAETMVEQWRRAAPQGQPVVYEPVGCPQCKGGYRGRMGVYELLPGTPELKQLVRSHAALPDMVRAAMAGGMRLLKQDAIEKALSGALDLAGARAASS